MSLPKLNTPVYEAILPSTDKVIKFRPFLVKEEKFTHSDGRRKSDSVDECNQDNT